MIPEGPGASPVLPECPPGKGTVSLLGEEITLGAGMTFCRRAFRRISRSERAYRPAGTKKSSFQTHMTQ